MLKVGVECCSVSFALPEWGYLSRVSYSERFFFICLLRSRRSLQRIGPKTTCSASPCASSQQPSLSSGRVKPLASSLPHLFIYLFFQYPLFQTNSDERQGWFYLPCALWPVGVVLFSQGNVFKEIDSAFASGFGWLITFCFDVGGDEQKSFDLFFFW